METVCPRNGTGIVEGCELYALTAALHAVHIYCSTLSAALICCCAPRLPHRCQQRWRGQNLRGIVSLALCVTWVCGAAAAALRPSVTVRLVAASLAPLAWLGSEALHLALWTRRSPVPLLYLAIYWLLAAASSIATVRQLFLNGACSNNVELYIQVLATLMTTLISGVDYICFYDEVTKRRSRPKNSAEFNNKLGYKHNATHFYSKITFFWLNSLLYQGYDSTLELDDIQLPKNEKPEKHYKKLKKIYKNHQNKLVNDTESPSLWRCYMRMIWPNFYIAGVMKLFGDLIGIVPPLGLAVIIQFIEQPTQNAYTNPEVDINEFYNNGHVMLVIITLALIIQALLSQNSTHLVTIEGIRLKTGLQSLIYDKCMRLASWSVTNNGPEEESPFLNPVDELRNTQSGLITNLVSQDTYNVMSCVWICHYTWAIPIKVTAILYILYTKLGISAILGSGASILIITPLQFYIGKKLSDNSKDISKCTDHRVSKMTEILQGINVIKLYVWEDLFNEKILHLREVELKLLNKDSIYWSLLTFTTQLSTILVTVITFIAYYFLETQSLSAMNVFAGLALFNQLSVPLLILPVTVLMVIQAMVSTQRIGDFLRLPESKNISENDFDDDSHIRRQNKFNDAFIKAIPEDDIVSGNDETLRDETDKEYDDQFSDDEIMPLADDRQEYIVRFRNAAFSWGSKSDFLLEVEDLDIPAGKLIMIVGSTGSGKSSLISAILGEMCSERGEVYWNGSYSAWYAGQPPWLLEGSVRDNIVMDSPWCPRRYTRVLRATGLQPDLQLLPEGDSTRLGRNGAPLSGGQRVRVCAARALYSRARLLALDEPLGSLDAVLARRLVAHGLLPAARRGRTVLLATNRLELLHYAHLVIVMEDGRIAGMGRSAGNGDSVLGRWMQLASEARACAARGVLGPPGGSARERSRLARALSRNKFQETDPDDVMVGINEAAGAHLLTEVPTRAGGSWRRTTLRRRPVLCRQLSSPPLSHYNTKYRREVRRAVSADASSTTLRREASALRRLLHSTPQPQRTLTRWTPRTFRRLLTSDVSENQNNSTIKVEECEVETSENVPPDVNGIEAASTDATPKEKADNEISEWRIWREYGRACGWWGVAFWVAAMGAQALAVAADFWLAQTTARTDSEEHTDQQKWQSVRIYAAWSCGCAVLSGLAGAACACAGGAARRALHEQLLQATLHAPLAHHAASPLGAALHRFSADVQVIDRKLPTGVSRWAQLLLLCTAAVLVSAISAPWSLVSLIPAILIYYAVQSVYLSNARELQRLEACSAGAVVSTCAGAARGASSVRAGRLQPHMRARLHANAAHNHLATLLLNAANRWLGLALDLVGACSVCVCVGVAMWGGGGGAGVVGLAGAYSLLLPAFLAHLAKGRADLDLHLASLYRLLEDARTPHDEYREDCPIPAGWQRHGQIEFQNVTVQELGAPPILHDISLSIAPGEKVAICGRSGSGKSTLLLTCAGAARLAAGRLMVDGWDARRVPLRAMRHRLVLLPQEAPLFSGTLRENLDPLAVHTDEEIWQSLRAVGLQDFVSAQPAGLECSVSGCWGGWSAGRRGRAGAARAALQAPLAAALLLDEPAAALDAPAERALLAALAAHAPNTTLLAVLHRISSVRSFDRVVVLEEGRVVEEGPTSTLLAQPTSRVARMLAATHRVP